MFFLVFSAGIIRAGLVFVLGNVWLDSGILEVFSNFFMVLKMFSWGQIPVCFSSTDLHHEGKAFSW